MVRFSPLGWEIYDGPTFVSVSLAIALGIAGTVTGSIALHRVGEPLMLSGAGHQTLVKQAHVNAELVELSATFSSNEWCNKGIKQTNACVAFLEVLVNTIQDLEFDLRPESEVLSDLDTTTNLKGFNMSVFKMADTLSDAELKTVAHQCIEYTVTTHAFNVCILPKGVSNGVNDAAEMMAFVTKSTVPHGRRALVCGGFCIAAAGSFVGGMGVVFVDNLLNYLWSE